MAVDKMKIIKITIGSILFFCFFLFFSLIYDPDSKDLGNGFVYNAEHKHIVGKIDIPPTVISYDFDKYFIVIKQKPKAFDEAIYDKMEYCYPMGRDTIYYWLIIKKGHCIFGPLDENQFKKLKEKYNVKLNCK
jgi:hypothetical protein